MRNRIVLTGEQRGRLDAVVLDGVASGIKSDSELAEYTRQHLQTELPPRPALEWISYVKGAVKRLRDERKIRPGYTTPRGAARGGWRLA